MDPCKNCKEFKSCKVVKFFDKNFDKPVGDAVNFLFANYPSTSIVNMITGKKESITLECRDYDPVKEEEDYSGLVGRTYENGHKIGCNDKNCRRCRR